jgi:hypothetical protein
MKSIGSWRDLHWEPPSLGIKAKEFFFGYKPFFIPTEVEYDADYAARFKPDDTIEVEAYSFNSSTGMIGTMDSYKPKVLRKFRAPNWTVGLTEEECFNLAKETENRDEAEIYLRQASRLDPNNLEYHYWIARACQFGQSAPGVIEDLYPEATAKRHYVVWYDALIHAEMAMYGDIYLDYELEDDVFGEYQFQFAFLCLLSDDANSAAEFAARALCDAPGHEGAKWVLEVSKHFRR